MTRLTVLVLIITSLVVSAAAAREVTSQSAPTCAEQPYAEAQVPGTPRLRLELAITPEQHQRGLMFRESLPVDQGMLFIFGQPSSTGFWMVNTLIPLTVAYLGPDGTIQDLFDMAPLAPGQAPVIYAATQPYVNALEVNQGWFATHGVNVGDVLKLCYQ
jgi:uncharacterized membrane protein (UPF0127 family)